MVQNKSAGKNNLFLIYIITILAGIGGYLIRILFARELTVSEYGLFYAVYALIFFFAPFRDLGLTESMLFYVNKYLVKRDKKRIKEVVLISLIPQLILGVILSIVFILSSHFLAVHYFKNILAQKVIIILSILFSFQTLYPTATNLFNALHEFTKSKLLDLLSKIFILLFAYILIKFIPKVLIPAASYLLGYAVLSVLAIILLLKENSFFLKEKIIFERILVKKMFNYALPILFSTGAGIILGYSDMILLTYLKGVEFVGLYNIALPCLNAIILLLIPLSHVLFPIISRSYHSKDHKRIKSILKLIYDNLLIFTLPLGLMFFAFAPLIIKVLFGVKYVAASNALRIFSLFFIFMAVRSINFSIIAGIGKPKERSIILYYGAGFNVLMDLLLIPKFGISGAAFATGLGYLLMAYLTFRLINKYYPVKINLLRQAKTIIASIFFLLSIYLLRDLLLMPVLIKASIILLFSFMIYLLSLFLLRVINKEYIMKFKNLVFENLN